MTEEEIKQEARVDSLARRVVALIETFGKISLVGGRNIIVSGNPSEGFVIDKIDDSAEKGQEEQGGGGGQIRGCTDPTAENYNPDATIDNGTCIYAFGACCVDTSCFFDTHRDCNNYGVYMGDNVPCSPNPCLGDTGACCDNGGCSQLTAAECPGQFQGVGTDCDSTICPVTGACCLSDGSCSETTQEACLGDYQGDGTHCGEIECPVTPCPSISLVCDQACASATKCGEFNPSDGKVYKTFVSGIHPIGGAGPFNTDCIVDPGPPQITEPLTYNFSWDVFRLNTRTFDDSGGPCTFFDIANCGGTSVYTGDNADCPNCGTSGSCDYTDCTVFDAASPPPCSWASDAPCTFIVTPADCFLRFCVYSNFGGTPQFDVRDYSNEYTTAELISHVDGMLVYPGTFTGACSASRNLTGNEVGYSACRFRYKFQFTAQAFDMVISWVESGPDGDNPISESVPTGSTETSVHTCFEPSVNGSTTIRDITCEAV